MIKLCDLFQEVNDLLPEGEKVNSLSVVPMPYEGYFELYVESKNKKRYRCMCTDRSTISPLIEFKMPYEQAKEK